MESGWTDPGSFRILSFKGLEGRGHKQLPGERDSQGHNVQRNEWLSVCKFHFDSLHIFLQEEWLTCQRNWLYLESIFNAPDIQRQLPAEAKMFLQVDKSWKEIMRKVNRLPNALRAATQPGRNFTTNT